jgi:hypothetical protein
MFKLTNRICALNRSNNGLSLNVLIRGDKVMTITITGQYNEYAYGNFLGTSSLENKLIEGGGAAGNNHAILKSQFFSEVIFDATYVAYNFYTNETDYERYIFNFQENQSMGGAYRHGFMPAGVYNNVEDTYAERSVFIFLEPKV